jgi:hypothetical protein
MPVESRQGPIYFHSVQNKKYRKNWDAIFGKKTKDETKPATEPVVETKVENQVEASATDAS